MAALRPETVRVWGREAQDLKISEVRAAVIAKFVDNIATIVRAAALSIDFDSEPSVFVHALQYWKPGTDDKSR